ncbi:hypothetical protein [Hydrogenophaga sp.]|nr:hypothetical protein [Hydrogenophaga sp.]
MARMNFKPFARALGKPGKSPGLCALHKKRPFDILKCHVRLTPIDVIL